MNSKIFFRRMTVVLTVKTQLKRILSHLKNGNPTKSSKSHFSKQHVGNDLSSIGQWRFGMTWMTHLNYIHKFPLWRAQWKTTFCIWSSIHRISPFFWLDYFSFLLDVIISVYPSVNSYIAAFSEEYLSKIIIIN